MCLVLQWHEDRVYSATQGTELHRQLSLGSEHMGLLCTGISYAETIGDWPSFH